MYLDFFKLHDQPFRMTPDPRYLYLGQGHSRAMAYLDYSVWNRDGFVLITGEIGSGKTTLLQKLLQSLDEHVVVARIYHTRLDETDFLQAVLLEFGLEPFGCTKVQMLDMLNTFLLEQYSRSNRVILAIDEAQNLGPDVLEEVRLLSGLETEREKLMNVILIGQPELNDILDHPSMAQLLQRIRFRFHLKALSEEETQAYVRHRISVAGGDPDAIFSKDVYGVIYAATDGVPRLINTLCDTALLCAFADGKPTLESREFNEAREELQWTDKGHRAAGGGASDDPPPGKAQERFEKLYAEINEELRRMESRLQKLTGDFGDS